MNLTIRNIPDYIIRKIKTLSEIEKRSLNSEILIILEKGLLEESCLTGNRSVNNETQIKIWNKLSGEWKDKRSTDEIIEDIYSNRSAGREFSI
jgi:plasmid stability protein